MTDILALARALAPHVSASRRCPWHAAAWKHDERFAVLVRGDGARILLRPVQRHDDRVAFIGCPPEGWIHDRHAVRFPRATAARDRDPVRIARTLCARGGLLELYEGVWSKASRVVSAETRSRATDEAFLDAIASHGGRAEKERSRDPRAVVGFVEFRPMTDGYCEVRGDVPRDIALALAAMISERAEAERAADELAGSLQLRAASAGGDRGAA